MKNGHGFLLVFSITSNTSLAELASLREEIIRIKDDENVPIVICGNKADLQDQRTVPRTKGFSLSQRWGAPYYEASARTRSKGHPGSGPLGPTRAVSRRQATVRLANTRHSQRRGNLHRSLPADAAKRRCRSALL